MLFVFGEQSNFSENFSLRSTDFVQLSCSQYIQCPIFILMCSHRQPNGVPFKTFKSKGFAPLGGSEWTASTGRSFKSESSTLSLHVLALKRCNFTISTSFYFFTIMTSFEYLIGSLAGHLVGLLVGLSNLQQLSLKCCPHDDLVKRKSIFVKLRVKWLVS